MGSQEDHEYEGVRAASKSSIEIDFRYAGKRYRERIKLKPTPANMIKAAAHRQQIIEAIEAGNFDYAFTFPTSKRAKAKEQDTGITVAQYLRDWLEEERKYLKTSTSRGYEKIVYNQLIPQFGELPLEKLTRRHVKDFTRSHPASSKTLGNIISPLRIALENAVEDELIDENPLEGWKLRRKKRGANNTKNPVDPLTHAERQQIATALEGQALNFVEFAWWTGLRTSELIALDWTDIDFEKGVVHVTKALTQAADEPEEPKTVAGNRQVKLLSPALQALEAQKAFTYDQGLEVFQNPRTLERWTGDQPIRRTLWTPALKKAEVRYRKPYVTRHTYASMMLTAGESVQWVALQLGHRDWAFTARVYAKYIKEDAPRAGEKAEALYHDSQQNSQQDDN